MFQFQSVEISFSDILLFLLKNNHEWNIIIFYTTFLHLSNSHNLFSSITCQQNSGPKKKLLVSKWGSMNKTKPIVLKSVHLNHMGTCHWMGNWMSLSNVCSRVAGIFFHFCSHCLFFFVAFHYWSCVWLLEVCTNQTSLCSHALFMLLYLNTLYSKPVDKYQMHFSSNFCKPETR